MLLQILVLGGAAYALRRYQTHRRNKAVQFIPHINGDTDKLQINSNDFPDVRMHFEEKQISRDVAISFISLTLAIFGNLLQNSLRTFSLPGTLYVLMPLYEETVRTLWRKKFNAATLLTIAVSLCIVSGLYVTASLSAWLYTLSQKSFIHLKRKSRRDLLDSYDYYPQHVWLSVDDIEVKTPFKCLKHGDIVIINAGEVVPVDGCIIAGTAVIDQHMLTGMFRTVEKTPDDYAFAASLVVSGRICVRVERLREQTTAAQVEQVIKKVLA